MMCMPQIIYCCTFFSICLRYL